MKNMLPNEFHIYGKRMRPYYRVWGLAVSEDGKTVIRRYEKDYSDGMTPDRPPHFLKIQKDKAGRLYIHTLDHGNLPVAGLVMKCFGPPCPVPNQNYELAHKDGNLANCHYTNLEWRKIPPMPKVTPHTTANKVKLTNGLTVHKDGTVYDKKDKLTMSISHFDSDTGLEWSHTPKVTYYRLNKWKRMERESATMDSLMEAAGYVAGEKYDFANPRILHKDYDWLNFDSSNLEWCDASDPRYSSFLKQQRDDMNAWNKANNKDFPDSFLR